MFVISSVLILSLPKLISNFKINMHYLNLVKFIENSSNLGGKEPLPRIQTKCTFDELTDLTLGSNNSKSSGSWSPTLEADLNRAQTPKIRTIEPTNKSLFDLRLSRVF